MKNFIAFDGAGQFVGMWRDWEAPGSADAPKKPYSGAIEVTAAELDDFNHNWQTRRWDPVLKKIVHCPPPAPPEPTKDDVDRERARRIALGFTYDFGDARGLHKFGMTASDMEGWSRVTALKDALLAAGQPDALIEISTDTAKADVSAAEWNEILLHGAQHHEQPIWQACFTLQAMHPIPPDYLADEYWP